jgi:hypothetical protein
MRLSFAALFILLLVPSRASADDTSECVKAHEEGQVARREGRFSRAREAFAACQRDACPAAVRARCGAYARDLEAAQPTLVVVVRDAKGADANGARVSIDGAPQVEVSGMGLRLNPGKHTLAVEAPGFLPAEKTVTLSEGVKNMQAIVSVEAPAHAGSMPASEPEGSGKPATGAWAFAIGGGIALVAAGGLSAAGWVEHENLKSSCAATGCSEQQVAPLRVLWPASVTALGVGVVSEVVALVLFATHSRAPTWSALLLAPTMTGIHF